MSKFESYGIGVGMLAFGSSGLLLHTGAPAILLLAVVSVVAGLYAWANRMNEHTRDEWKTLHRDLVIEGSAERRELRRALNEAEAKLEFAHERIEGLQETLRDLQGVIDDADRPDEE